MNLIIRLTILICAVNLISACGGSATASREELNDIRPYVPEAEYASVLRDCAMANLAWSSCSLNRLPTLAMTTPEPSIDDVMSRVVVSHQWMGLRFEQLLRELPDDMLYLFGAVTAIVIDDDIRPSYYWSLTGAIYLDPASLWLTLEEKDSINRKPDFRQGNESEMRFRYYARQAINGANATRYYGLDSEIERPLKDIVIPMANLLFHELAHANDQLPRASYPHIDRSQRISYVTDSLHSQFPSTILKDSLPLNSEGILGKVADIFYRGHTPTEEQTQWTAAEVGAAFAEGGASDNYGYSTQYEDLAMLFEDTMMYIYFDVEKEIAFIEAPEQKHPPHGEAFIGWGARNRIGDPWVKERVKLVLEHILPDRDYTEHLESIPEPTVFALGTEWSAMIEEQLQLAASEEQQSNPLPNPLPTIQLQYHQRRDHPLHAH